MSFKSWLVRSGVVLCIGSLACGCSTILPSPPSASSTAVSSSSLTDTNESGLTVEEQKKVDAGEYVAASVKHRAFNVPKPVFPEAAREETLEGAEAFIRYWVEERNYASSTGDVDDISRITAPDNDYEQDFYRDLRRWYSKREWLVGLTMKVDFEDNDFVLGQDGFYRFLVRPSVSESKYCKNIDYCARDSGDMFRGKPGIVGLYYDEGWVFGQLIGVEGINYEE
ncbi:DUF6318 family protein [Rothia sp. P13129]|uniref:DUF6318 family protein n=1 Tax=Rothia sp. P13129 TaxID=3402664 RepID=UPI003AC51E11